MRKKRDSRLGSLGGVCTLAGEGEVPALRPERQDGLPPPETLNWEKQVGK